jgi:hypothetical protein
MFFSHSLTQIDTDFFEIPCALRGEGWIVRSARDVRYGAEGALILSSSKGLLDPPSV